MCAAPYDGAEGPRVRFKVPVHPNESLPSILARSARAHVLYALRPVMKAAGLGNMRPGRLHSASPAELTRLAHVLRQQPTIMLARAATPAIRGIRFGTLGLPLGVMELDGRLIAPTTLERSSYHRFSWNNRLLPFCPDSGERLVATCPHCSTRLGWFRTSGIGICEGCGQPVPPSQEPPLSPELRDGYRRLASLFSLDPAEREAVCGEICVSLRQFDPGTIALTGISLCSLLESHSHKREMRATLALPPTELASLVSSAGQLITDFRRNTRDLLEGRIEEIANDHGAYRNLWQKLKAMGNPALNGMAASDMIIGAFPEICGNVWSAPRAPQRTYQTQKANRLLGVGALKLHQLAADNFLKTIERPSGGRRDRHFVADEIDELRQAIKDLSTLSSFGIKVGIPYYGAEQLAAMGILTRSTLPAITMLYGATRVERWSIDAFIERLHRRGSKGEAPPESLPLHIGAAILGGRAKPWGPLLAALAEAKLPFWSSKPSFTVRSARVMMTDLRALDLAPFDRSRHDYPFSGRISQKDAAELLNLPTDVFMESGLIKALGFKPERGGSYADFDVVEAMAGTVVSRVELARTWGVSPNKVGVDTRLALVSDLGFGWCRRQLTATGHLRC